MKMLLAWMAITTLAIAPTVGCNSERDPMNEDPLDGLYFSTDSETRARVDRVLPSEGSEDARHVLGDWKPDMEVEDNEQNGYQPETSVDWVIDVEFPEGKAVDAWELANVFNKKLDEAFVSADLYGIDAKTGLWTYLIAADGPEKVTGLKIAYDYCSSWDDEFELATIADYEARLKAAERTALEHIGPCRITHSLPPSEAVQRAQKLSGLNDNYDKYVAIYLGADEGKPFQGREIWDVMLCLGLEWGDMDCFHWNNFGGAGDDYFFSVETSTPPGYFLPEQIAAGQLQTADLIFLFSVSRTCQPAEVAKRMEKAVQYCQKRLGGTIRYTLEGEEMSASELLEKIGQIESELNELGFPPGSDPALRMF